MQPFNYRLISLARDARGLTQADLAIRANLSQSVVSKYETGLLPPQDDAAKKMAAVLRYPLEFFFQNEQTYGFPPFHFRKRKKLAQKTLNRIVAEMNIRRMHIKKLSISYELAPNSGIPEIDLDEYQGISKKRPSLEDLANHMRAAWGVPNGPIDNMVELIERNGGIVIPCEFGTDHIDAMSQRIDGMPVLFFINAGAPADRIRHALAHEFGHMLLHTLSLRDDEEMEREADMFAGAFLVPSNEFKPQMRQFSLRHLANLKSYWKVSMASLAVRAGQLNLITPYQQKTFWIEMNRLQYRKREPVEVPFEWPKVMNNMVQFHQKKLGYSHGEMAALLNLLPLEFDEMYGSVASESQAPRLRIVK